MTGLRVEPRLDSFNMDSIFGDTLPTLPYNSFTGTHNVFFHEGLQAVAPVESTSLEDSGSMEHSSGSGSPTTVMTAGVDEEKPGPAAKGSRGGRKSASKVKDQEQLERIRAKNRRAQSRYRAKLKTLQQTTIQSHDQVAEELARLRVENAALAHSNDLMDRVLTVREDYMASLKTGAALMDADTFAMGSVTDARRNNGAALALPESAASVLANGGIDGDICPITGLNKSEVAKIKCSDAKAVVVAWQTLVPRLEDALTQLKTARDDRSRTEADEAMHEALQEARMYCFEHAVYKPHNVQQLLAANLGVGKDGIADVDHWAFVMSELELTEEQRHSLAPLRELFLRRISRVMAERRAILGAIASASPHDSLQVLQESTATWLSVNRATGELSANLQQEHMVCMEFVSRAFGGVLSPLQKAVAIVRSYPYFPDIYSISTAAIGVDHHQPASLIAPSNGSANNNSISASDSGSIAASIQTDDASHGSCP